MVSAVVVVLDELADLFFEIARQVIIFEKNPVLECLMPAFDLTLGLRLIRGTSDVLHALPLEPICEFAGDVG